MKLRKDMIDRQCQLEGGNARGSFCCATDEVFILRLCSSCGIVVFIANPSTVGLCQVLITSIFVWIVLAAATAVVHFFDVDSHCCLGLRVGTIGRHSTPSRRQIITAQRCARQTPRIRRRKWRAWDVVW